MGNMGITGLVFNMDNEDSIQENVMGYKIDVPLISVSLFQSVVSRIIRPVVFRNRYMLRENYSDIFDIFLASNGSTLEVKNLLVGTINLCDFQLAYLCDKTLSEWGQLL